MGKDIKKTIAFLFFLLAGIVLGTVTARLCESVSFLSWLAYTMSVGLDTGAPLVLDPVSYTHLTLPTIQQV